MDPKLSILDAPPAIYSAASSDDTSDTDYAETKMKVCGLIARQCLEKSKIFNELGLSLTGKGLEKTLRKMQRLAELLLDEEHPAVEHIKEKIRLKYLPEGLKENEVMEKCLQELLKLSFKSLVLLRQEKKKLAEKEQVEEFRSLSDPSITLKNPPYKKLFGAIRFHRSKRGSVSFYGIGNPCGEGGLNIALEIVDITRGRIKIFRQLKQEYFADKYKYVVKALIAENSLHMDLLAIPEIAPHIVRMDHIIDMETEKGSVMERCAGELYDFLYDDLLSDVEKHEILIDIVRAVAFLHQFDYVHGDLKLENILLITGPFEDGRKGGYRAKLADFGASYKLGSESILQGTPDNLSPETLQFIFCKANDDWALGLLAYEMRNQESADFGIKARQTWGERGEISDKKWLEDNIWPIFLNGIEGLSLDPEDPFDLMVRSLLKVDHTERLQSLQALALLEKMENPFSEIEEYSQEN